ncbi:ElaA protein [Tranquillimonas rosea]|uniref:ElaA protein n=1 Tax=Tranquillimonas rosea TaxID=641238 RepID=A0A1H9U8H3_9RHOB|nr:GNAT family N-acetyltransferase [Tranquillimonas rosea]SES05561.1 ElaA protein [Tranquillimonas rosea]
MSRVIARTDDLAACHDLRRAVFMDEQDISEADEFDDLDDTAIHLLATEGGRPVGTARLLLAPPLGKIGRVCVLPDHRGTGLGAALIRAAMDELRRETGVIRARLGAQVRAMGFYARLGFAPTGEIYDDAGIPHRDMERSL